MSENVLTLNMKEHRELFWGGTEIPGSNRLFNSGGGILFETDAEEMEINASLSVDQQENKQDLSATVFRGVCVSVSDDKGASWRGCRVVNSGATHSARYPIFRYAARSPAYVAIYFPMGARVMDMELRLYGNKEIKISPVGLKGRCLFIGGPITYGAGVPYTYDTLPNLVMQRSLINIYNNSKNTWDYTEYYMDGALMELSPEAVVMECVILKSDNRRALREFSNYIMHIRECSPDTHLILWLAPYGKDMTEGAQDIQATIDAIKAAVSSDKRVSVLNASGMVKGDKKDISSAALSGLADALCDNIMKDPVMRERLESAGVSASPYVQGDKDSGPDTVDASPVPDTVEEAQIRFEIPDGMVITADAPASIESVLDDAGSRAASGDPVIVYAPPGIYKIHNKLTIPENVTLVAEKESVFEADASDLLTQMITVHGNIYGGTYDCRDMTLYGLRFGADAFRRNNGIIEGAYVRRAKKDGIIALGIETRFACMYDNTVSECGGSGIAAEEGAWVAVVSGNNCSDNKGSGIRLADSNVNIINNNVLSGNGVYGIGTETNAGITESAACQIHKMVNNEISGNGSDGVYIAENCYVDISFAKNDIRDNCRNGLKVGVNSYVNAMVKNRFNGNIEANIFVSGEGSSIAIGNSNVMQNADINLSISEGGSAAINGDSNKILTAASHGILVSSGAVLHIGGEANRIAGNGGAGIMLTGSSAAKITNTVFKKNKKFAVRVEQGSSFDYDKSSNIGEGKEAENRVFFEP